MRLPYISRGGRALCPADRLGIQQRRGRLCACGNVFDQCTKTAILTDSLARGIAPSREVWSHVFCDVLPGGCSWAVDSRKEEQQQRLQAGRLHHNNNSNNSKETAAGETPAPQEQQQQQQQKTAKEKQQ